MKYTDKCVILIENEALVTYRYRDKKCLIGIS